MTLPRGGISALLMVSLAATAALAALSGWLSGCFPNIPLVLSGVTVLVSLIVTTALFALLYRVLPDVHLRWRDVTTGAFVTAVLFTIGQQLIGLYLGQSSVASSYGATGSVLILLLCVYYSCQILLLAACGASQSWHSGAVNSIPLWNRSIKPIRSGGYRPGPLSVHARRTARFRA